MRLRTRVLKKICVAQAHASAFDVRAADEVPESVCFTVLALDRLREAQMSGAFDA